MLILGKPLRASVSGWPQSSFRLFHIILKCFGQPNTLLLQSINDCSQPGAWTESHEEQSSQLTRDGDVA